MSYIHLYGNMSVIVAYIYGHVTITILCYMPLVSATCVEFKIKMLVSLPIDVPDYLF